MNFREILSALDSEPVVNADVADPIISSLVSSSRYAKAGSLFFAIKGTKVDGREFILQAVQNGTVAVVADHDGWNDAWAQGVNVPIALVSDARRAKSLAAKLFYQPQEIPLSIGVTGTNGKTSTCWMLAEALTEIGCPTAYMGTLGYIYEPTQTPENAIRRPCDNTTPDPVDIHSFIGEVQALGAKGIAMEVTSIAIDQQRAAGFNWDCAVFTNLTRDHLDYHNTLEAYAAAKKILFFEELKRSAKSRRVAVVNADDLVGRDILTWLGEQAREIDCYAFSVRDNSSDAYILNYKPSILSTAVSLNVKGQQIDFNSRLVGNYNVVNLLTAACVMHGLGFTAQKIASSLSHVRTVPGRLDRVADCNVGVFVDYAHTPDALVKAQLALREIGTGRLITVFGCGGDRDRGKRPIMAQEVARNSDYAVITSDNPRTEDPERIIGDVLAGMPKPGEGIEYVAISDRRKAINHAVKIANPGDVILVAGKGHEDYQDINGVKHHFSDREECFAALKSAGKL